MATRLPHLVESNSNLLVGELGTKHAERGKSDRLTSILKSSDDPVASLHHGSITYVIYAMERPYSETICD